MGMPIASSPREASSTSGQRLLDEARLMPIHVIAALACLGGAALDGYILGIVGPALALAKNELLLTATSQGLIACSALIGVFIGGLVFGNFADRYGRRPVFSGTWRRSLSCRCASSSCRTSGNWWSSACF